MQIITDNSSFRLKVSKWRTSITSQGVPDGVAVVVWDGVSITVLEINREPLDPEELRITVSDTEGKFTVQINHPAQTSANANVCASPLKDVGPGPAAPESASQGLRDPKGTNSDVLSIKNILLETVKSQLFSSNAPCQIILWISSLEPTDGRMPQVYLATIEEHLSSYLKASGWRIALTSHHSSSGAVVIAGDETEKFVEECITSSMRPSTLVEATHEASVYYSSSQFPVPETEPPLLDLSTYPPWHLEDQTVPSSWFPKDDTHTMPSGLNSSASSGVSTPSSSPNATFLAWNVEADSPRLHPEDEESLDSATVSDGSSSPQSMSSTSSEATYPVWHPDDVVPALQSGDKGSLDSSSACNISNSPQPTPISLSKVTYPPWDYEIDFPAIHLDCADDELLDSKIVADGSSSRQSTPSPSPQTTYPPLDYKVDFPAVHPDVTNEGALESEDGASSSPSSSPKPTHAYPAWNVEDNNSTLHSDDDPTLQSEDEGSLRESEDSTADDMSASDVLSSSLGVASPPMPNATPQYSALSTVYNVLTPLPQPNTYPPWDWSEGGAKPVEVHQPCYTQIDIDEAIFTSSPRSSVLPLKLEDNIGRGLSPTLVSVDPLARNAPVSPRHDSKPFPNAPLPISHDGLSGFGLMRDDHKTFPSIAEVKELRVLEDSSIPPIEALLDTDSPHPNPDCSVAPPMTTVDLSPPSAGNNVSLTTHLNVDVLDSGGECDAFSHFKILALAIMYGWCFAIISILLCVYQYELLRRVVGSFMAE
ncbi:hypothetical protein C0991_000481 [Blastosporella zonata]|nr:hypothetical protein C0991_000481 [Blastosporella zonata]